MGTGFIAWFITFCYCAFYDRRIRLPVAVLVNGIVEVPVVIYWLWGDAAFLLALGEDLLAVFHVSLFYVELELQAGAVCDTIWQTLAALWVHVASFFKASYNLLFFMAASGVRADILNIAEGMFRVVCQWQWVLVICEYAHVSALWLLRISLIMVLLFELLGFILIRFN